MSAGHQGDHVDLNSIMGLFQLIIAFLKPILSFASLVMTESCLVRRNDVKCYADIMMTI